MGSFTEEPRAHSLKRKLEGDYGPVTVSLFRTPRGSFHRVLVGDFPSRAKAMEALEKLRSQDLEGFRDAAGLDHYRDFEGPAVSAEQIVHLFGGVIGTSHQGARFHVGNSQGLPLLLEFPEFLRSIVFQQRQVFF